MSNTNVPVKFACLVAMLSACSLFFTSSHADTTWTAGAGDWNTGGNWNNGVPSGSSGQNRITNGGHATISGNVGSWGEIRIGDIDNGTATSGTLTHSAGSNTHTSWLHAARGGQNTQGTFNMAGGTLTTSGNFRIAGENNLGGASNTVGTYNQSGGTYNVSQQTFFGAGGVGAANINITGGTLNANGSLGGGFGGSTMTINHSAGTVNVGDWLSIAGQGGNDAYNASGSAVVNSPNWMFVGESGGSTGTLNVDDGAQITVAGNGLYVGRFSGSVGVLNQNDVGTSVRANILVIANDAASTGTYNLNGGRLRTNTIDLDGGTSTFNWGNGTISSYSVNTDTDINVLGSLTTGHAGDVNAVSTLDLGNLGFSGTTIWDTLQVNGDLNLTSSNDVLDFWDTISALRPAGGNVEITGEIELVNVTGSLNGQFSTVNGPGPDSRFFRFYETGAGPGQIDNGTLATELQRNSGYLDYRAGDGIYFVYNISGTVPEPGTAGLLLLGVLLIKGLRSKYFFGRNK
jgi:hypothetical protein